MNLAPAYRKLLEHLEQDLKEIDYSIEKTTDSLTELHDRREEVRQGIENIKKELEADE